MGSRRPEEISDGRAFAKKLRVRGRVQGVGFRWWTRNLARELDLAGSVRNCADGSVEAIVKGAPRALEHFKEALRCGPPGSRVEAVEESPLDPPPEVDAGGGADFRIVG